MNIIIPTLIIFLLCTAGLAVGLFFKRKPIEKRCGSDPDEECHCKGEECEKDEGQLI